MTVSLESSPADTPERDPASALARRAYLTAAGRVFALVVLVVLFGLLAPGFLTRANWLNTSVLATTALLLGLGETFVIITAGIDLSVGATLGVSSSVAAIYLQHAGAGVGPVIVAIVLAVATGVVIGTINGLVIVFLDVTPFITTLGMLGIGTGVTYLITNGSDITIPSTITPLGDQVWASWLPVPVVVTIGATLFAVWLLRYTAFGIRTYAVGSNLEAARRAGVSVGRHLLGVYMLSGLFAGIAGVLTVARFAVGSPTAGQDQELDAIAAVVIGGASLFGGEGGIGGTVIGALFVSALTTGLVLRGTNPYWQTIALGLLIMAAVGVQQVAGGTRFEGLRKRLAQSLRGNRRRSTGG